MITNQPGARQVVRTYLLRYAFASVVFRRQVSVQVVFLSRLEVTHIALVRPVVRVNPDLVSPHVVPSVSLIATRIALQDGLGRVQPYHEVK